MAGVLTAAIAAAFSGVTADLYYEYTTLLLPGNGTNGAQNNTFLDGSTNNFTITRNGNTTQGTFSPFSQTGWGNYFSGSSQYLSVANNTALNLSSGNFTIEAFVYYNGTNNAATIINKDGVSGSTYQSYGLKLNGSGYVTLDVGSGNSASYFQQVVSTTALPTNTWTHVAAVKSGTTLSVYQNGIRVASATQTGTIVDGGKSVLIGYETGQTSGYYWNGYISNLRVVKGVAVYSGTSTTTANFDVPTSPLAATQSSKTNIAAITTGQTSLLTCQSNRFVDNGQGNTGNTGFTITLNGSPTVVAFSPFNPTASWSAATYGGSGYFDGSGDYLDPPSNAAFQFGTGDFCLEGWIYPTDTTTRAICGQRTGSAGDNSWVLACNPANSFSFGYVYFHTDNTAVFGSSVAINTNAWTHVVFTCVSGRYRIFQNGILSGTTLGSYNFNQTTGPRLGAEIRTSSGATAAFLGWINGWRITKGGIPSAYSTASTTVGASIFTPPSTPATNSESLTAGSLSLLLNFTNAGIYDATSKNDLETVGNAQISTTQSKWGGSSMYFDGTGDWLIAPSNNLASFETGDFSVEMWVYPTSVGGGSERFLFDTRATGSDAGLAIYLSTTGVLSITSSNAVRATAGAVSANTWSHVAVTRSSGTLTAYVNGTAGSPASYTSSITCPGRIRVGIKTDDSTPYVGYINDLRITKGYARTMNPAPTAAFPTL